MPRDAQRPLRLPPVWERETRRGGRDEDDEHDADPEEQDAPRGSVCDELARERAGREDFADAGLSSSRSAACRSPTMYRRARESVTSTPTCHIRIMNSTAHSRRRT